MTEVVLVSCSKSKQDGIHAARDLYEPSRIFRKRREFALRRADHWGILSGKHGYLRPWEAVEYYEMHRKERSDVWGALVLDDLLADLEFWDADQVTILAGKDYVDPLVPELESRGIEVLDYNRGLQSGERYSKLKEELAPGEQQTLVTDGGEPATDIERFIERNRESLEGNPTEYARGYETCLDRLEKFVEDDGLSGDSSGELGMDHYRDIQEDDRFELNGTEWHVRRIHDEFGSDCDYSRMIEAYDPGGVCQLFVVYPTEVRRMTDFVSMNRGEYEVVAERPQQTLATDGGYDVAIITDEFVRDTAAPAQEAESWCHVEIDDPAEEASGYWFPCRLARSDVGDGRDAVPDPDQLAHDDVLQFPLESRQPELAGGALPPEETKDRVVEDPLDDFLPED